MRYYHKDGYRYLELNHAEHLRIWEAGEVHDILRAYSFHPKTPIEETRPFETDITILRQRMTGAEIVLRKFNWPYVPGWVKRKQILMRTFPKRNIGN